MRLDDLNALDTTDAERELRRCCGSSRWAAMMAAARPFVSADAMALTADVIWAALDRVDWLEAFSAHPRIGDDQRRPVLDMREHYGAGAAAPGVGPRRMGKGGSPPMENAWAVHEQSGVADDSRARFEQLNRDYEARFGYIFIVCATGKSGAEMQAMLERRMTNRAEEELREAADEQRRITRLRLEKLLT